MHGCSDCKKDGMDRKSGELSSRISSMRWHMDDYDRMKGKGKFKKDHPDTYKMFETMLNEKTDMLAKHMKHDLVGDDKPDVAPGGVAIG